MQFLDLMDYYFPMIEDIFDSYGLPAELKYMAVIESALNPNAVSQGRCNRFMAVHVQHRKNVRTYISIQLLTKEETL